MADEKPKELDPELQKLVDDPQFGRFESMLDVALNRREERKRKEAEDAKPKEKSIFDWLVPGGK